MTQADMMLMILEISWDLCIYKVLFQFIVLNVNEWVPDRYLAYAYVFSVSILAFFPPFSHPVGAKKPLCSWDLVRYFGAIYSLEFVSLWPGQRCSIQAYRQ